VGNLPSGVSCHVYLTSVISTPGNRRCILL